MGSFPEIYTLNCFDPVLVNPDTCILDIGRSRIKIVISCSKLRKRVSKKCFEKKYRSYM